jgi:hypothetical protein
LQENKEEKIGVFDGFRLECKRDAFECVRVSGGPERVPNITQVGSTVPGHPLSKDFIMQDFLMHTLKRTRLKAVATRETRRSRTKRDNLILVGKRPIIPENNDWGWVDGSESGSALL